MSSEDNFLRLDTNNYDDEFEYHVIQGDFTREDLINILSEGYIDIKTFINAVQILDDMEAQAIC